MTDYQRLVDFFMDEIPEDSPFEGKIRYLVEKLIAEGVTFQKWIPVTERLPEPGVEVYVCDTYGDCFLSWMKDGCGGHSYWFYTECGEITHWVPLPEPPKEK